MYVAPTPFGLASGIAHRQTLILPEHVAVTREFKQVGTLIRTEASHLIVGYTFDLENNTLTSQTIPNPFAGRQHIFQAWRLHNSDAEPVIMKKVSPDENNHDTE
jgi:hypothetical protein